jgi:hypothetical protein
MGERTAAIKELKAKFFFADALANSDGSVEDAVNEWFRRTRDIQVYDIVRKHCITASRDEGIPYIGVVYCHRR